ncbi:MAG: 50S ribosomal protein L22 [Candidatus Paceibacterota bacterium]|jgi:large subunit ribosomal protein L22
MVSAKLSYLRISPRKARLVADLVRGKSVEKAQSILSFTIKRAASPILKLLNSAVANAKNNFHLDAKGLYVARIWVNEGAVYKRVMPRARGNANQLRKRTCHVELILAGKDEKIELGAKAQRAKTKARKAGTKTPEAKPVQEVKETKEKKVKKTVAKTKTAAKAKKSEK